MSWVLKCFNTEATVRAFFCLQKKPSLTLNCAFFRGSSFGYFSFKKSNTHPLASPDKSKFEESALECDTAVSKNKTDMRFAFGLLALFSLGANVAGIDTGQLFVEL